MVIAMFAIAPAADASVCGGEGLVAVRAADVAPALKASAASIGEHQAGVCDDADGGVCQHGHCHHGGVAKPIPVTFATGFTGVDDRQPIPATPVPVSDPRYGLDRPPRV